MDKLKEIKIKQASGEYGDSIPIGADALNIDTKTYEDDSEATTYKYNLQDVIGTIYVDDTTEDPSYQYMRGSIETQLKKASLRLEDLEYIELAINSLKATMGSTSGQSIAVETSSAASLTTNFAWTLNKEAASIAKIIFNGSEVSTSTSSASATYDNPATSGAGSKSFVLSVTDNKAVKKGGVTKTATSTVNFYNGTYYGAAAAPTTIDSAFILTLNKKLQSGRAISVTNMGATGGKYYWYAIPTRLNTTTPSFSIGGFASKMDDMGTVSFTNASGFTENYEVYRTQNINPGTGAFTAN